MLKKFFHLWLTDLWKLTGIFCLISVIATIPILFPFTENTEHHNIIRHVCGWIILIGATLSCCQLLCSAVHYFLKMRNLRAMGQIVTFLAVWGGALLCFTILAIEADINSPYPKELGKNIEKKDTVHEAKDKLLGPSALCSYLKITDTETEEEPKLMDAEHLVKLETEHPSIFEQYLSQAPKWAYTAKDDTFYSKAGHVVLVAPAGGGIPGTVHAAFRTISAGEQLPEGYSVIAPGEALPGADEVDGVEIPDLAVDLGGKRYLLLAWRGVSNRAFAVKAINAALKEIDRQLAPLAEEPTESTVHRLIHGQDTIIGKHTELLISEPTSQFGIYQAEIYANPGRAGTLMLVIRDRKTQQPLLIFSQAARYSDNPNELFRHDVPRPLHDAEGISRMGQQARIFDDKAPFFAIKEGESHRYFEITAEVHFSEAGSVGDHTKLLFSRHYIVQAYEREITESQPETIDFQKQEPQ